MPKSKRRDKRKKQSPIRKKKTLSWDGKGGYLKTDSHSVVGKFNKHHQYKGQATDEEIEKYWN